MDLKQQYNSLLEKANRQEEWINSNENGEEYIEKYSQTLEKLNNILKNIESKYDVSSEEILKGFK